MEILKDRFFSSSLLRLIKACLSIAGITALCVHLLLIVNGLYFDTEMYIISVKYPETVEFTYLFLSFPGSTLKCSVTLNSYKDNTFHLIISMNILQIGNVYSEMNIDLQIPVINAVVSVQGERSHYGG